MFFSKKEAVDIRDLPRPKANLRKKFEASSGTGFIDFTKPRKLPSEIAKEKAILKTMGQTSPSTSSSPTSSFSFFDTPTTSIPAVSSNSSDTEDLIRKLSSQISDLDSKLYKMEQRIELLERKAGVGDSSSSTGGFAW